MSSLSYTNAQRTAVFYPDGNLLLSAAAGSGKTAALTGRIVELIREGRAELSDLLVVTFTRAAAAEMRSRISQKLQTLLEESRLSDPALAARVSRSLAQTASADISTIHSFLYSSLRPFFPLLGLSSDARIAETRTVDAMKKQVMRETADDFFRRPAGDPDPAKASFPELADIIGQARDSDAIDAELLWLADRLLTAGRDEETLLRFADELDAASGSPSPAGEAAPDLLSTGFGAVILDELRAFCRHYRTIFAELREEFAAEPKTEEKYGPDADGILERLDALDALLGAPAYESLRLFFTGFALPRLPTLPKKDATETSDLYRHFRDEIRLDAGKRLKERFFSASGEEARQTARLTARILRCAAEVIGEFLSRFRKAKADAAILDYGDLEWFALRLFLDGDGNPTKIAGEIGARYQYLFVDEYQDTNDVQDRIFRALCSGTGGGKTVRFLVGDVKQSIYRFRGADPSVFSEYRRVWENQPPVPEGEAFPPLPEAWDPAAGRSLFMSENFRCAKPVVDFTNCVSEYLLPCGSTPFDEGDRLIHARGETFDAPPVEVCLIRKDSDGSAGSAGESDDEPENVPEESGEKPEAAYVARRIAAMIGRYTPEGTVRRASDIAILLRSPSSSGEAYQEALAKRGISSRLKTERPLGTFPSVMLLMCLLHFVDNPLRDIPAAGALRSPVFGFTLSDLIALKGENGSLWEGLCAAAADRSEDGDGELREKCVRALAWHRRHQTVSGGLSAEKYLEYLIRDTDLYAVPGIRGVPSERNAVQKFTRLARTCERTGRSSGGFGGLSGFLDFAEEELQSTESGGEDEDGGDCVSILSIHASKGLEFPVCFLSDCAKKRNTADETRTVLFDPSLGFGMSLPDESGLAKCETLQKAAVSEKIRRDSIDEEMRMLYVALTRAQNQLILTAAVKDPDEALTEAAVQAEFSDRYRIGRAPDYITWVLEALSAHPVPGAVKIVTEESGAEEQPAPAETTDASSAEPQEASLTKEEWAARFGFRYPESYRNRIPAKLTVSRLHPQILDEEDGEEPETSEGSGKARRPQFMQAEQEIRPTDRGSAAHIFLQFTDYRKLRENGAAAEIARLTEERYLTAAQASLIPRGQIERFRESALMDALLRSDFVRREFRFNVRMAAERFTSDGELREKMRKNGDRLTVQGVVDCVYRDPDAGNLVLVDYKTDTFTAEEYRDRRKAEAKLRERHRRQLMYYREICERLFGEEIGKALIYSTVLGTSIEL